MEANLKTLAETKRRLFEAGLATLEQLAAWADDWISELAEPPHWLIAVSTARSKQDAANALLCVDGVADATTVWREVARGLLEVLDREPGRDGEIGKYLYDLGMNGEAATLGTMGELMSFWDSIDLARVRIYGDPGTERRRLREFLALGSVEGGEQPGIAHLRRRTSGKQEMPMEDWKDIVDALRGVEYRFGLITAESPAYRIQFAEGLTDREVETAEERFEFRFPPDLRAFLQTALPRGPRFPDWRSGDVKELQKWLDLPKEGILFDVEENKIWLGQWGTRPADMGAAIALVSELIEEAPRLIPIYGHRMMPEEPNEEGNPVFSVHQTDIIYYGADLRDYLSNEFSIPGHLTVVAGVGRRVRFWTDIVESNE